MNVKELISKIIEEELVSTDCFLVGVDVNQAETDLKFFIDGTEGVSVQVCTKLSRKISRILDEEYLDDQPIRYEISSPGVDQPLVDKRQYHQHIGSGCFRNTVTQTVDGQQCYHDLIKEGGQGHGQ